jgi:hypothetical protein
MRNTNKKSEPEGSLLVGDLMNYFNSDNTDCEDWFA